MKLRDIIRRYPTTIGPEESLGTAAKTLLWYRIRHLPVVSDNRLVGIVSDRDVASYRSEVGPEADTHPIDKVMTRSPQTAGPDISITEAAARMAADKIGCLPITEKGQLLSLVTVTDVLTAQVREATGGDGAGGPRAADVMTREPTTVRADQSVVDAALLLDMKRVRHLPVVDADGALVGIMSDRDIAAFLGAIGSLAEDKQSESLATPVERIMSRDVVTAQTQHSLENLAAELAVAEVGALPVLDTKDRLVGIVSVLDVLRRIAA